MQQVQQQQQQQQLGVQPSSPPRLGRSPLHGGDALALHEAAAAAAAQALQGRSGHGARHLESALSVRSAVAHATAAAHAKPSGGAARRHTAPALVTSGSSLGGPELLDQLTSTASRLESLRLELESDLRAGQAASGDGVALSRVQQMLQACSLLCDAGRAACGAGDSAASPRSGAGGATSAGSDSGGEEGQEVALHDDGAAGVGATAAAAVSVALAQSWAAAAGARQASFRHAAAAAGVVKPGKARFKLVAAVPRSYRRPERALHSSRAGSTADLGAGGGMQHAYASRLSLAESNGTGGGGGGLEVGSPASARAGLGRSTPFQSTAGLVNLAEAEPRCARLAQ